MKNTQLVHRIIVDSIGTLLPYFILFTLATTGIGAQEGERPLTGTDREEFYRQYRSFLEGQAHEPSGQYHKLAREILHNYSDAELQEALQAIDKEHPQLADDKKILEALNHALMKKLHGKNVFQDLDQLLFAHYKYFQKERQSTRPIIPKWCRKEIKDADLGGYQFTDHLAGLQDWVENRSTPQNQDLGLNFVATDNNEIEVLSDKEQFWPALMQDLAAAKDHIHINVFGFMGDSWGREVTDLLAKKVQEGVKVKILADALGARMHWYFGHKNEEFIKELRDKGIEVILTSDEGTGGNFHFDHRKFYVIDGKLAYNTGYTIEEHMRKIHFDMGMRIKGDMVKQLQSHFFASYFRFGGKMPQETSFAGFMKQYYPEGGPSPSKVEAKLLENIPWVQHRVTESYYSRIANAKKKVTIINEFLSEPRFLEIVKAAADRGVEVEIIYPRISEWAIHRMAANNFFQQFADNPKVHIYLYDGPENTGWLHTKGIVIDDNYINFGSTNMDSPSLYHNYELNIETSDPKVVQDVKKKIIDYAKTYSRPFEYATGTWDRFKVWGGGVLSKFPQGLGL